jgi:antitoxin Phd
MRLWPVQDAKARLSELLETCLTEGPQMVTKRGKPKAVLVSLEEWERLQKRAPRSIKEMLLAPEPRFDLELPLRGELQRRKPVAFE